MYTMLYMRPEVSNALSVMSRYKLNYGEAHWAIVKNS
jgi:hypothetical protein